jgi:hypothetical protein
MVCIKGGPVSDVEARQMPLIREQIVTDLGQIGVTPVITIEKVESFAALGALVDKLRPELCSNPAALKQCAYPKRCVKKTSHESGFCELHRGSDAAASALVEGHNAALERSPLTSRGM